MKYLSKKLGGCHSTVKTLTYIFSCLKELQGSKLRGTWVKQSPATGQRCNPALGEVQRPDTITEAMEHSQKRTYHDRIPEDPRSSWKCQMQIFAPNLWTEAADLCGWIMEELDEVEEQGNPVGGPAVSINLDPWDLSNTLPLNWQHAPADKRLLTHIKQRTTRSVFRQRRCT